MGYDNLEPDMSRYITRADILGGRRDGSSFWLTRGDNGIYLHLVRHSDLEILETGLWGCGYFERGREELLASMRGICTDHKLREANGFVAASAYYAIKPSTNFTGWRYWLSSHPDQSVSISLQNGTPNVQVARIYPRALFLLENRELGKAELEALVHDTLEATGLQPHEVHRAA